MLKRSMILAISVILVAIGTLCFACNDTGVVDDQNEGSATVAPHDHDFVVKSRSAATCEEGAKTNYVCKICGDSYVETTSEALGHVMGDWREKTPAGCVDDGLKVRSCIRCNGKYKEEEVIPATGHRFGAVKRAASCVSEGYTRHTCEVCKYSYIDEYVEKTDHEWNDMVIKEADGSYCESRTCSFCRTEETFEMYDLSLFYHTGQFGSSSYVYKCWVMLYKNAAGKWRFADRQDAYIGEQKQNTIYVGPLDCVVYGEKEYLSATNYQEDKRYSFQLNTEDMTAEIVTTIPSYTIQPVARKYTADKKYTDEAFGEKMVVYYKEKLTEADFPTPPEYEGYEFAGWLYNDDVLNGAYLTANIYAKYVLK